MGHYIENATTRRARVLVYAGSECMTLTDISGIGAPNQKYVMYSPSAAARDFVSKRAVYRKTHR